MAVSVVQQLCHTSLSILLLCSLVKSEFAPIKEACNKFSCENNGRCISIPDYGSICVCAEGFTGHRCERRCDCLNDGRCFFRDEVSKCVCPVGFNGSRCEFRQPSVCDSNPCGAKGTCKLLNSLNDFRCECHRGWIGERCNRVDHCLDNPCVSGQCVLTSTTQGFECRCPPGRHGARCEVYVNSCLNNPCQRGKCINKVNGYECECPVGFTGRHCEQRSNPCEPNPCNNDAHCYSYRDGHYTCECRPGFTGRHCEVNIDDCSEHACMNGAICVDGEQGYVCNCAPGFTGEFCEKDVDECTTLSNACQNGGTCVNRVGGYHCICVNGWEGDNCEINKDDCNGALCEAGSTCVDHVAKYTCLCPPGKIGLLCHIDDPCMSNPCKGGATCEAETSSGKYVCNCPKGYTGEDCSEDVNECEQGGSVCANGGTCVNTPGSYHCECPPGFTEPWCMSQVNRCLPSPCLNQGTCLDYGVSHKCVCMLGYYGEFCERKCPPGFEGEGCVAVDKECNSSICVNGGVCSKGSCRCPVGFSGKRCELRADPCTHQICGPNAVCEASANGVDYHCNCKPGFHGPNCRPELVDCASNPCQHDGRCTDTEGGFTCACVAGYSGARCEVNVDDCAMRPCLHTGTCIDGVNSFTCHCPLPYDGDRCQFKMDPCRGNSCENGALCRPTPSYRNYTCECLPGYFGLFCQMDIDECAVGNPCKNDGRCVNTVGSYRCRCPDGFTGYNCEVNHDDCASNPCLHGGRCVDEVNGFRCECPVGFTGRLCSTNIDDCAMSPCLNGASCVDRVNGFTCVCRSGFSGALCDHNDDDCQPQLCLNGGTCVDGVNRYHCRCARGFTGANCQNSVDLEQFNRTDVLERQICVEKGCAKRANNGICDASCNYYGCGYDGGDCSAGTRPFEKCSSPSFCAHVFRDGKCDQVCNNENCLFDGFDCDNSAERCLKKDFCASRYANGQCDAACNNVGCGWDGGDCDSPNPASSLVGDVVMVVLISPEEFLQSAQVFLLTLSQKVRASVRIRMSNGRPMIYEWSSESGVGKQMNVPPEKISLLSVNHPRSTRDAGYSLKGTMVMLIFDVARCLKDDRVDCFSDVASVASYLGAANAKQDLQELGMPMYSAHAELPKEETQSSFSVKVVLISCVFVVVVVVAVAIMLQGRKRRTLHAPIWKFPESCKTSLGHVDGCGLPGGSIFDDCGGPLSGPSVKRARPSVPIGIACPNVYITDDAQQLFLKPKVEPLLVDEREWTDLHESADSELPIQLPIPQSLVNVKGKGGRTALMLTASNSRKDELNTCTDIANLLSAGADINAKDDDEVTALMLAVKTNRAMVVDCLISHGADLTIVDSFDRTLLHHAVVTENVEIMKRLLETRCISVDAYDVDNRTALVVCAKYNMSGPEMAEMLLREKADVAFAGDKSMTNYDGKTPLHFAAQLGNRAVVRTLIHHGANKDAQDQLDQTPLFLAASEGRLEMVELLISLGASKDITDQKERSPKDVAKEKNYMDVVHYLEHVPAQRHLQASMIANVGGSAAAQQRFKKSSRKPSGVKPTIKKLVSPHFPLPSSSQSAITSLTPPPSDGSNYSTTPSPNSLHPALRGAPQNVHAEGTLHSSSVMLSPYSDYQNGIGCSPPQMFQLTAPAGWPPTDLSGFNCDDGHVVGYPSRPIVPDSFQPLMYSQHYPPHMPNPSCFDV